jgi:protein-S-isoprenylcysteine O-methyltransferase Ste14
MDMNFIPILELPILIIMVLIRFAILSRHGIKAIVFGVTDKTGFIMLPVVLCFFYAILSIFFNLPFPDVLTKLFIKVDVLTIIAITICTVSLIWFGITLKTFGKSFRVGIDESTNNKLITNGTFSISRNPIYITFIAFFIGIFVAYPNIVTSIFLVLLVMAVHRQILREEKFLKSHYGEEYDEYCSKVRRYI